MEKNMNWLDRVIRLVIAAAVFVLYKYDIITGAFAIVLLILSAVFILTAFVSYCPLYQPFGINTRKKKK